MLTAGLLRCGRCGGTLTTYTERSGREVYICLNRRYDASRCNQRPVPRTLVDGALLREVTARYLDLEETRKRIAERRETDVAAAREALAQAEQEAVRAEAKLERVRGHYQEGRIEADDWAEQRPGLIEGLQGAREAVQRAQEHVSRAEQSQDFQDAEEAVLRHLSDLKAAVAEGVTQARDLAALRATLKQLFEAIELIPAGTFGANLPDQKSRAGIHGEQVNLDGYWLLPHVRAEAFDSVAWEPRRAVLTGYECGNVSSAFL